MGASCRDARSSPTAIGLLPFTTTRSALPPAASMRSSTQSQARPSASASPPPVETDGMRNQSSSSSRIGWHDSRSIVWMRRLFWLVAAVVLVDTMFFAAVAPLLPHYSDELDLSKTGAGVLTAAYPAGTFVGALPAGWLAIRWGVKPTLMLGLAMLGLSSLAFAFAGHIVLLDSARFIQGVGGACMWAAGMAWLVSAAPVERRGELIGAALSAAIVGVLLGPGARRCRDDAQPRGRVQRRVALVAAVLAAWAWSMPGVEPEESPGMRAMLRALAPRPPCWPASGCSRSRRCSPA